MIREQVRPGIPGIPALLVLLALLVWLSIGLVGAIRSHEVVSLLAHVAGVVLAVFGLAGLFIVNPNEAKVLQLFGSYAGSAKVAGLRWANPLYSKRRISLRIRNFESARLKVNDAEGNPIEIAAVVVWRQSELWFFQRPGYLL